MATTTLPPTVPPRSAANNIYFTQIRRMSVSATPRCLIVTARVIHSLTRKQRLQTKAAAFSADGVVLLHDAAATVAVSGGAYALVSTFDYLTTLDIIEQKLSRKLVHILSGLLFMASWPFYSTSTEARYIASIVPFLNCFRLIIYGFSMATDDGHLTKSLTREGKPEELLKGPFYYVLVLMVSALVFWRESPVGVISVAMMCAGDGIADIVGRRFGSLKLPYNQQKSFVGSISMFAFGFLVSVGMLYYFSAFGFSNFDWDWTIKRVALIALVATLVESLPASTIVDDNISVPLASMITGLLIFRDL